MLALALGNDPSARMDVPGGSVRRRYDLLALSREPESPPPGAMELGAGEQRWGSWRIICTPAQCPVKAYLNPGEFYLKPGAYSVRPRQEGDKITLGRRPEKAVKKLKVRDLLHHRRAGQAGQEHHHDLL